VEGAKEDKGYLPTHFHPARAFGWDRLVTSGRAAVPSVALAATLALCSDSVDTVDTVIFFAGSC
jgi:hypothetical protein